MGPIHVTYRASLGVSQSKEKTEIDDVWENKAARRMLVFGPKKEEETQLWRKIT
jgi:hypothetical protein